MSERIEFPAAGVSDGEIRLRLGADTDIRAIVAACQDPEIPRWTRVPEPYGEADARGWIDAAADAQASGESLGTVLVDARTDELLGSVGLVRIDWAAGRSEVGYWLAREARGRGLAARAVRLLSAWAFENLALDRLEIQAEPDNEPSRRVAERAGYKFEGVLRSYFANKGRRRDAASYSLIRGELPS